MNDERMALIAVLAVFHHEHFTNIKNSLIETTWGRGVGIDKRSLMDLSINDSRGVDANKSPN